MSVAHRAAAPILRFRNISTCVFIDGPHHDTSSALEHDNAVRNELENLGYRVIAIRHDRALADQLSEHTDVFGVSN